MRFRIKSKNNIKWVYTITILKEPLFSILNVNNVISKIGEYYRHFGFEALATVHSECS